MATISKRIPSDEGQQRIAEAVESIAGKMPTDLPSGTVQARIASATEKIAERVGVAQNIGTNTSTALNGILKGAEGKIATAAAGTDYVAPSALTSHTGNTGNPHGVTAAQVKALPLTGGTVTGALTVNGGITGNLTGSASKLGSTTVGSASQGIYLDNGTPKAVTKVASATSADTATKLGSANVGTATQPIYLSTGTPKACTLGALAAKTTVAETDLETALKTKVTTAATHATNKNNPHGVTAAQIGAVTAQVQTSDPGAGTALATGTLLLVYEG